MDVIAMARELGKAIQQDERFIRYAKARLANDSDSALQEARPLYLRPSQAERLAGGQE